jgi:hypothetical protein
MATTDFFTVSDFPAELVAGVAREAEADARHVCLFLEAVGVSATPERPVPLPAHFLLDLAAALRLLIWERSGLRPQNIGNLPLSRHALREVLLSAATAQRASAIGEPGVLARRVVAAWIDHFAWGARVELGVDVLLEEADDEALLEALADFLWDHRPR